LYRFSVQPDILHASPHSHFYRARFLANPDRETGGAVSGRRPKEDFLDADTNSEAAKKENCGCDDQEIAGANSVKEIFTSPRGTFTDSVCISFTEEKESCVSSRGIAITQSKEKKTVSKSVADEFAP
jgi:hypothetical protein